MSAYVFYIKQGDRRPNLVARLRNADNTPLDLTDADNVTFIMKKNGTVVIDKVACVLTNTPTDGVVTYEWQENDTDTLGTYKGEFEITWATGITQTMPEDDFIKVVVKDDLA